MIEVFEAFDEYALINGMDEDEAEEGIIFLYLATRLKPLLSYGSITKPTLNNVCEIFADHYFDYGVSLDLMINALYNYVNDKGSLPLLYTLENNINNFLADNLEE